MNRKAIPLLAAVTFATAQLAKGQAYISRLASFNYGSNGSMPEGSLIADAAGNLYGTTNSDGTVFELAAGSSTPATLVSLGYVGDPVAGLVADASGNLYGTTYSGGLDGDGTVFEVAAVTHSLTTLVNFGNNGSEGGGPTGLIIDASGNLYGTTENGGPGPGDGTVFEVAANTHALTTLATFNGANGANPSAGLVEDSSGNLYGTTFGGGDYSSNEYGDGTVFEVAAGTHTLTTLATFNGSNGEAPKANLIEDASGNLYGTTFYGGDLSLNVGQGDGTVFEVAANTHTLTTLATFNGANGDEPVAGLIADADGNLYGTAYYGDNRGEDGNGTVYEVAAGSHVFSVVFAFNGANGSNPSAGLIADAAGNLYGTTVQGGTNNEGTVFELSGTGFVVPEPTSGLMLLIAGAGMFMRRSRMQSV